MPSFMRPMLQEEAACSTWSGRRSGLSDGLLGGSIRSSASSSVGPLYQPMLSDFSIMLSPWKPEIGTKFTCGRVWHPALTVPRNQQMIFCRYPGRRAPKWWRACAVTTHNTRCNRSEVQLLLSHSAQLVAGMCTHSCTNRDYHHVPCDIMSAGGHEHTQS